MDKAAREWFMAWGNLRDECRGGNIQDAAIRPLPGPFTKIRT
jgi:hypothetical protein